MRTRRGVLAGLATGLSVAISGCLGFITGRQPLVFEASDVSVTEAARESTGFERTRAEFTTITRQVTVAGQTRTIEVNNYIAEYKRQLNLLIIQGELARFTVVATPKVEVAGQALNPYTNLSTEELAQRLQQKYSRIDNLQQVGSRQVPILGTSATVTRYAGTATIVGGQQLDVYVSLAKVSDGDDTIIALAIYPRQIDMREEVSRMLRGIQH